MHQKHLISMKYGLYNPGNYKVIIHKKKCCWLITYNGIEYFPTILGHPIVSRVMTFRNKKFGKYEICDGFYNSLLCVILKVNFFSKCITYPKGCFSWPILNRGAQKGWK